MALQRIDTANEKMSFKQLISTVSLEYAAGYGQVESSGTVSTWKSYVGAQTASKSTGAGPLYDATDPVSNRPSVIWDGGGARMTLAHSLGSADFSIIAIFRDSGSGAHCLFSWSDDAVSVPGAVGLYCGVTAGQVQFAHVPDSGGDVYASDAFTYGTGWHLAIMEKAGTALRLQIDGRTAVTATAVGTTPTLTRLTLGAQKVTATHFYASNGALARLAVVPSRGLTANERTEIRALAKLIEPGLP